MLDVLFERYKSKRKKHFLFYENEFYEIKNKPLQILQVNIEPSLLVWHKYFERSHIFCLDEFKFHQPEHFRFLFVLRIHWLRCNVYDKKNIDNVMKNYWNNPRFDIIIDNTNQYNNFRKYCIGNYYIEKNDNVMKI